MVDGLNCPFTRCIHGVQVKRTNLRFVGAYLVVVAVPLLVLTGVLHSSRTLAAPASVGGLWRMQANPDIVFALPCGQSLAVGEANFTIVQSGRNFTLSFVNSTMSSRSGVVEGTVIKASILPVPEWARANGCNDRRSLTLTAAMDSNVNAHMLSGSLLLNDCPACTAVPFHAIREEEGKPRRVN